MNNLTILLLMLSCNFQEKQAVDSLINTKWQYKVADGCTSYIQFKYKGNYEDYDCERDYPFSGKYEIKKDTVYLIQIDLATDLPGEKRKVVNGRSRYLLKGKFLHYLGWEEFKDNHWSAIILPPHGITYDRVR